MSRTQKRAIDPAPLWITLAFLLLTVAMTWPLTAGLARDVPGDLGDSLLNLWILGWGAENVPRLLTGRLSLTEFWNANIFHPAPLALSFSEHLFGEVLQILPIYQITGNLLLSYNVLFLSSFVLSGLGMYLLTRDVLGEGRATTSAACLAALIYAFIPLRIAQVAHIQSLNSQWMPLALYGFRRFIHSSGGASRGSDRLTVWPLAGGTCALLMQNWSNGYYLIFFTPFVGLFVVHQIVTSGRAREWQLWVAFAAAAGVVTLGTWPFLSLYVEAQRVHGFERSLDEVIRFSADVYSYLSAPEALRIWGRVVQAYPKPEGELFFGVVPMVLFVLGLLGLARSVAGRGSVAGPGFSLLTKVLAALILIQLAGLIGVFFTGGFITSLAGIPIRATNPQRIATGIALASAVLLAVSASARQRAREAARSPLALVIALTLLAAWLSLGPLPQSRGQVLPGMGLYRVLYDHVPGFDGLRVPARYAMIVAVFLSVTCGFGARALLQRTSRPAIIALVIGAAFIVEAAFVPMPVNQTWSVAGVMPPPRVEPAALAPAVYRELAVLPDARVIAEFPFGDPAWELRYVYYSTVHWKRLVNGYSGGFPRDYTVRAARLQRIREDPEMAWQSLRDAGTTHVIVHEAALPDGDALPIEQWLTAHGAQAVGRYDSDVLYALP
jgi:hypothetical protein